MKQETRIKYLEEVQRHLHAAGFTTQPKGNQALEVKLDGKPLCQISAAGGIGYFKEDAAGKDMALDRVRDTAEFTREYMALLEQAPPLIADGLGDGYKLLAEFNGTVLAGHMTQYGAQFITWEWINSRTSLWQGHYYGAGGDSGEYQSAKRDFAARSGLLPSGALFTEEQLTEVYVPGSSAVTITNPGSTSSGYTEVTDDLYYKNGSLGTLKIPAIDLTVNIYQGTDSASLQKGAGHFEDTSIWDGNIGLAAHNRNSYFGKIHKLEPGDTITLTTRLGTRTYEVTSTSKVNVTDRSSLTATADNCITMYTGGLKGWSKYYPCLCIKYDETVEVRWLRNQADASRNIITVPQACATYNRIIGCAHCLVYKGKSVFDTSNPVYSAEGIRCGNWSDPNSNCHFNPAIASNTYANRCRRTLLGHHKDGYFLLINVAGDKDNAKANKGMNLLECSWLLQELGCDYGMNMDGGSPTQMRVNGVRKYPPTGTNLTANDPVTSMGTCVCAYNK